MLFTRIGGNKVGHVIYDFVDKLLKKKLVNMHWFSSESKNDRNSQKGRAQHNFEFETVFILYSWLNFIAETSFYECTMLLNQSDLTMMDGNH